MKKQVFQSESRGKLFSQKNEKIARGLTSGNFALPQEATEPYRRNDEKLKIYKVARVIDGDTIELEGGERVRYIGINAPELYYLQKPVECFANESKKKNQELTEGKEVILKKDTRDRDKYGRLLRYVFIGDTFVNLELVQQGFAYAAAYPPDAAYQNILADGQKKAKQTKKGLWGACPA